MTTQRVMEKSLGFGDAWGRKVLALGSFRNRDPFSDAPYERDPRNGCPWQPPEISSHIFTFAVDTDEKG